MDFKGVDKVSILNSRNLFFREPRVRHLEYQPDNS